ncbi:MAG: Gfo/Idh/MocA family oxidoreductase [Chloroflexota bacterium]|nr:Gfo/Idh/MocA family oxidoreductase [Chloroflexota bacterium]
MRLGILSLAHVHAESYLAILRDLEGVELVGLWDEDPARGEAAVLQHGTRSFPSAEALLAAAPDGVVVTSVNAAHRSLTELAAAAGVHVLSEKPLAIRLDDARAMLDASKRRGVQLMTAFPMRFSPSLRVLAAMIREGRLGEVVCCEGVNTGEMPNAERAWFVDPALAGGGALMDHVVHLADLFRWILRSEVAEVYATANHVLQEGYQGVETGGLLSVRFESGVFATIDCSWSKPRSYPTWGGLSVEIVGTRGVLVADAFAQHLELYGGQRDRVQWPFWGSDPNRAMLADFAAAIRDGREPLVTGLDGYRALEVVEAAYRSVSSGEPVSFPLPQHASR